MIESRPWDLNCFCRVSIAFAESKTTSTWIEPRLYGLNRIHADVVQRKQTMPVQADANPSVQREFYCP
jgi:hypothetical protein